MEERSYTYNRKFLNLTLMMVLGKKDFLAPLAERYKHND